MVLISTPFILSSPPLFLFPTFILTCLSSYSNSLVSSSSLTLVSFDSSWSYSSSSMSNTSSIFSRFQGTYSTISLVNGHLNLRSYNLRWDHPPSTFKHTFFFFIYYFVGSWKVNWDLDKQINMYFFKFYRIYKVESKKNTIIIYTCT